ncbi:glutaredoxin family protein [Mycobacterium hubeiense]|uniref:glutaredoxin family protein n=1 Tax=Mycobacterium hubeiense TaxID=1867256 RepID=UPI000C7F7117|nr:glutaredoxin family protein [Mycobacterium sp. QGD 101]
MTLPVQITLLTQTSCALCELAKGILDRLSQEYPLSVTEVDLRSDMGRRLAADAAVMFAPGVLVDGEPFSYGRLSERKLRRLLDRRAAMT